MPNPSVASLLEQGHNQLYRGEYQAALQIFQQAQRDRNLNIKIAIVGIGLATSQIASSVIIAQQTPPKNIPFYQTQAFWYSIGTGAIASLVFWIILTKILPWLRCSIQPRYKQFSIKSSNSESATKPQAIQTRLASPPDRERSD